MSKNNLTTYLTQVQDRQLQPQGNIALQIITDGQDIATLLEIVRVLTEATKSIQQEVHDERCDEDWHCNWCEASMIALAKVDELASEGIGGDT